MRTDKTLSDRKLTREEFCSKYWLNGDAPYQGHTMDIEDGRDEREQLIINNVRANREAIVGLFREVYDKPAFHLRDKKTTKLTGISLVVASCALVVSIMVYFAK